MEMYLEGAEIAPAELKAAIRRATLAGTVRPRSLRGLLPQQGRPAPPRRRSSIICPRPPTSRPSRASIRKRTSPKPQAGSDDEPFSALVFKLQNDPFLGHAGLFPGLLRQGPGRSVFYNANKDDEERPSPVPRDARQQAPRGQGGLHRGHRRHGDDEEPFDRRYPLRQEPAHRPRIDQVPRAGHLGRWSSRGPGSSTASSRPPWPSWARRTRRCGSPRTPIPARRSSYGMGELHLEIVMDRLAREFGVQANMGRPQVAYKETILRAGRGRGDLRPPDRPASPSSAAAGWRSSRCARRPGFVFVNRPERPASSRPSSSARSRTASGSRSISAPWPDSR